MRSILAGTAPHFLALACAATPWLAMAQRAELPPISPAAARPVVARTGAASTLAAPAVTATVRAAQTQVVDDDAHGAFKEGVFTTCTSPGVCTVSFSPVAAGHRRLVQHLACSVYVAAPGALRYVAFLANSFTVPREFAPYTRSVADAGQYFVDVPTTFPYEAGESPLIYAYADGTPIQDLTCTIMGRDIALP